MSLSDVLVLGVVQGLTEFLPVSSSGHLVAVRVLFGIPDVDGTAIDAFLHLGTLLAVLVYFWRVWWGIVRGLFVSDVEGRDKRQLAAKLLVATVPAAVVGYTLQESAGEWRSTIVVALGLVVTAVALLVVELTGEKQEEEWHGMQDAPGAGRRASWLDAVLIGVAQTLALVPGVSRAGITIAAGRARRLSRKQAAAFSFLLSAPIIAGAGLASWQLLLQGGSLSGPQMAAGFLVSFVSGVLAISLLLKLVERISYVPFTWYLIALAVWLLYVG